MPPADTLTTPAHPDRLYLLDGIGPFFRHARPGRVNWSKIPFADLEAAGQVRRDLFDPIRADFERLCARAAALGFNGVTLDDVAHLADAADYPAATRRRLAAYREEFARLFGIARAHGLTVYLTTDIMFHLADANPFPATPARQRARLTALLDGLFADFPEVRGIITRIGESDGLDVEGEFRSRLAVRSVPALRRWLGALLPVCAAHARTLIFRTWSVGAYAIGDLMWNRRTFRRAFEGFEHPRLILSLKPGESDFFRHLPLNRHFFRLPAQRKLIEIQARREYEGSGEYPAPIADDCELLAGRLRDRPDFAGVWIWCQTGGWSPFRRLTFLEDRAIWNELNTVTALAIFREGLTARAALERFRAERLPDADPKRFEKFARQADTVIKTLLYMPEFSRRKLFFRRLRLPPLLWVFWDTILVSHSLRKVLRCFVGDGEACIREGQAALEILDKMERNAAKLGLPAADVAFQRATFEILALAREYFFRPYDPALTGRLEALARDYRARFEPAYEIALDFTPVRAARRTFRLWLKLCLRDQRGYRLVDRLFFLHTLSLLYPLLARFGALRGPAFARRQAMGLATVFK